MHSIHMPIKNQQKNKVRQSGCGALFIYCFTNIFSDRFMKGIQPQQLSFSFKKSYILNFRTSVSIKRVNIICHKCGFAVLFLSYSQAKWFPEEQLVLLLALLHFTHAKKLFLCLSFGWQPFDTIYSFYALLNHAFLLDFVMRKRKQVYLGK